MNSWRASEIGRQSAHFARVYNRSSLNSSLAPPGAGDIDAGYRQHDALVADVTPWRRLEPT
jgi:hypothetical protein